MFNRFAPSEGKSVSAMSFVLSMLEVDCIGFHTSPAILMALFPGRLRSRSLTILHFREESEDDLLEARSYNCNFVCNFSSSVTLPTAQSFCRSFNDILNDIHGLSKMGEELWHRHMLDLTDRLRIFVSKNKSADSASLPARVKLVLQYVNKWLGAALGHLKDDDPAWWTKFSRALSSIELNSLEWAMALVSILSLASSDGQRSRFKESRDYNRGRYEEKAPPMKEKDVPEDIRAMIPVNRHEEEPCLRYLGGVMCSGGTRDRCGHPKRIHDWPSNNIPRRLREWFEDN